MSTVVSAFSLLASACGTGPSATRTQPVFPDVIYTGGEILTMDSRSSVAEAVAVKGEEIVAVGSRSEVEALAGPRSRVIDLGSNVLVPGFYAPHDHFPGAGVLAVHSVNLNSPPMGPMETIDDIVEALRREAEATPEGEWIQGRGYDDTLLQDGRHPMRRDLDRASTLHPIWISHTSGHLGVANSLALRLANITRETPQPPGGVIRKDPETGEPNGVFEESGGMVSRLIPPLTYEDKMEAFRAVVEIYVSKGVTTTVITGGYPRRSREDLTAMVNELHQAGYQIAIHANGDAAIDDVIHAFREAQREFPREDARHRIEHCQMVRKDQLDQIRELNLTPSFFVGHVYYWGDRHRDIFMGPERAAGISPLQSAAERGIRFTIHDDTPVTPVDPLRLAWTAVNWVTRSGQVLGPEERVSPIVALRAMTIDAAWQNFEEDIKGSIEPGKLADFVILWDNPLAVDPMTIKDIRVLETIVGGETVYEASSVS